VGPAPEPSAGLGPLVIQDLDIGQVGMVIHGGRRAGSRSRLHSGRRDGWPPGSAPVEAVATAYRDAAELLGVQVDQVTGMEVLIAADRPASWAVQVGQPVAAMTDQDSVDRGGR
jgi:hypothetical protein